MTRGGGHQRREASAPKRESNRAEWQFLAIMLSDPSWQARGIEAGRPEWFETPEFGEIFTELRQRPTAAPGELVETLSEPAQRAWMALQQKAEVLKGQRLDGDFVILCERLDSRPLLRDIRKLEEQLTVATEAESPALDRAKQQLIDELKKRYPTVNPTRHWGRDRAPRSDTRQRTR